MKSKGYKNNDRSFSRKKEARKGKRKKRGEKKRTHLV
jgi:hypothetical protein